MIEGGQWGASADRQSFGLLVLLGLGLICATATAADFAAVCADRAAIENVYYSHRLGTKPSFDQVLPPADLQKLVQQDLRKEVVLNKNYGVTITPDLLNTEVERITTTTRAPEMLAEIKAALDNDPVRFANSFAKPFLVERLLREKFANDEAIHAPQRRQAEQARFELLAAKTNGVGVEKLRQLLKQSNSNQFMEVTWQFAARPAETNTAADELEIKRRFGPSAQLLTAPGDAQSGATSYFADLPAELQTVLRVQLRQAGDVSAVIETPEGFLLYLAEEKTAAELRVAGLALPKSSYELWLNQQVVTGQ
jgi:hypothetical protein